MPEPGMGGPSDGRSGAGNGSGGGSGGTPGLGGSQDAGSGFSGPTDTGPQGKDDGPSAAEVQAAIDQARRTGKVLGVFDADDYADNTGILGLIGYDTKKVFLTM